MVQLQSIHQQMWPSSRPDLKLKSTRPILLIVLWISNNWMIKLIHPIVVFLMLSFTAMGCHEMSGTDFGFLADLRLGWRPPLHLTSSYLTQLWCWRQQYSAGDISRQHKISYVCFVWNREIGASLVMYMKILRGYRTGTYDRPTTF